MPLKINTLIDCGNAPRKKLLLDFNVAFAEGNVDFILKSVHEDVVWNMIGKTTFEGKQAFGNAIREMVNHTAKELNIHQIITHGKVASLNGEMLMQDNTKYAFCDVYEFVSAGKNVIKKLDSYVLPIAL